MILEDVTKRNLWEIWERIEEYNLLILRNHKLIYI